MQTAGNHLESAFNSLLNSGDVCVQKGGASGGNVLKKTKEQILRERAKLLAQRSQIGIPSKETIRFLEFEVSYERYGLDVAHIQEVAVLKDYTHLPCVPKFVVGIMNLRGRIISILDLKQIFELSNKGLTYQNKVIVIRNESMTLGFLADDIIGLKTLPLNQLMPALPTVSGKRSEYLKGLSPDFISVLDGERILNDRTLVVQDEVTKLAR